MRVARKNVPFKDIQGVCASRVTPFLSLSHMSYVCVMIPIIIVEVAKNAGGGGGNYAVCQQHTNSAFKFQVG